MDYKTERGELSDRWHNKTRSAFSTYIHESTSEEKVSRSKWRAHKSYKIAGWREMCIFEQHHYRVESTDDGASRTRLEARVEATGSEIFPTSLLLLLQEFLSVHPASIPPIRSILGQLGMADRGQGCSIGANRALIEAAPTSLQALQTAEQYGTKYHWGRWSVMMSGHPFGSRWGGRAERGRCEVAGAAKLGNDPLLCRAVVKRHKMFLGLGTFGVRAAADPSNQSTPKRAHSGTILKPWAQGQKQDAEAKLTGAGRFQVEQKRCQRGSEILRT